MIGSLNHEKSIIRPTFTMRVRHFLIMIIKKQNIVSIVWQIAFDGVTFVVDTQLLTKNIYSMDNMNSMNYKKFIVMMIISFLIMYIVMF